MKSLVTYINESIKFGYDSKKKSRYRADILNKEMPKSIYKVIGEFANEILPDIKNIPMNELENEIYEYFTQSFDRFWDEFYKYTTEKENDYALMHDISQDEKLKKIWDVWGDDIMQIFIDTINNNN